MNAEEQGIRRTAAMTRGVRVGLARTHYREAVLAARDRRNAEIRAAESAFERAVAQ